MVIESRPRARTAIVFWLAAVNVVAALLLGGGTRSGFLSDVLLQLLSLPLLFACIFSVPALVAARQTRAVVCLALAAVALPLLQLVPLPPSIWTALPGRTLAVETASIVGAARAWCPLSLVPGSTWLATLSLIPAFSLFLAVLLLSYRERRVLSLVVLAAGTVSVFVGLIQVAEGPSSALRLFDITHDRDATGFFASRNHFAALLYVLMLLAAPWIVEVAFASPSSLAPWRTRNGTRALLLTGAFVLLVVLLAAETVARSRAGLMLTILALAGAAALAFTDTRRATHQAGVMKLIFGAAVLAVVLATQFTLYRVLERFSEDPLRDARFSFAHNTIEAAKDYFPFGSGAGTFVRVYATYEQPADAFVHKYVNHAHDDFLEIWLETGLSGLLLLGLFLIWFVIRATAVWRGGMPAARAIDSGLAKMATVVVLLLLLHSAVDYPLRTGALMAVFAFAAALITDPVAATARTAHRSERAAGVELRRPPGAPPQGERWGAGETWPQRWHNHGAS
jgi:O-antigen ligase